MAKAFKATIRPGGVVLEPIVDALTGRFLVAHGAWRHTGFLSAVFEGTGLRLCGHVLDTAVLAAWVRARAAAEGDRSWSPAEISPGLSEAASAFGLPIHRLHEAGGEALTTAQLFMALASNSTRSIRSPSARSPGSAPKRWVATRGSVGKALRGGGTASIPSIGALALT